MLARSFRKHPDLCMALENPILTIREKFALICTAAVGDAPAGREFARFMTLVLKNRRENFLQYICLSFLDLYRKDKHIGVGKLITAVPVSQEVRERIHNSASTLLHASMELQTEVARRKTRRISWISSSLRSASRLLSITFSTISIKRPFVRNPRKLWTR